MLPKLADLVRFKMILFLTKDLMIQSAAAAAVSKQGTTLRSVASADALRSAITAGNAIGLFIDLQTPGIEVFELSELCDSTEPPIHAIAFAQHVKEDLLQSARNASFDAVLTRGQFTHQLPELVAKLLESNAD